MAFNPLGLAALVISALRTAVTDPELVAKVDANRAAFDTLTGEINTLKDSLAENDALDTDQQETLDGIIAELESLATALTGPADDPEDTGLIGEVEFAVDAEHSHAADDLADE